MTRSRKWFLILWAVLLFLPYLVAFLSSNGDLVFNGFLLNPIDGNSYLAKIQQGMSGSWLFQLPYSSRENGPALIFTFYLLLGRIFSFFNLLAVVPFHLARIAAALFLFFSLAKFVDFLGLYDRFIRNLTLFLLLFGGGLGWLYLFSGELPADFWVAEAFPFLAAFSNPHFPLAIALMLWGFMFVYGKAARIGPFISLFLIALVLANISPFAVAVLAIIVSVNILQSWREQRRQAILKAVSFAAGSAPFVIYQYLLVNADTVLAGWDAQNITPAPSPINFLFSFSPFLAVIIALFVRRLKNCQLSFSPIELGLLVWLVSVLVLLYLPLDLQRRFLIGYYVPVVALAFLLLQKWFPRGLKMIDFHRRLYLPMIALFCTLTNIFLLSGAVSAATAHAEELFISRDTQRAAEWMQNNLEPESVIVSGQHTGLYLPSYAAIRTVYGHPFETINYEETGKDLNAFWGEAESDASGFLSAYDVDYIYFGSEEAFMGKPAVLDQLPVIYEQGSVTIYEVGHGW